MDPSIRRTPTITQVRGKELQTFLYDCPFDERYINHLLETLLSIVRFGGQGFAKTARSVPIRRSHHSGLVQRIEVGEFVTCRTTNILPYFHISGGIPDPDASYLDALVDVLLR